MSRDDLIHRLATVVAGDAALLLDGWRHLVLVSVIQNGSSDTTGFCYIEDGRAVPVAPRDFALFDVLGAIRAETAVPATGALWQAVMIRIERATGHVDIEFEYHRPERWAVTPDNVRNRAREFAPA